MNNLEGVSAMNNILVLSISCLLLKTVSSNENLTCPHGMQVNKLHSVVVSHGSSYTSKDFTNILRCVFCVSFFDPKNSVDICVEQGSFWTRVQLLSHFEASVKKVPHSLKSDIAPVLLPNQEFKGFCSISIRNDLLKSLSRWFDSVQVIQCSQENREKRIDFRDNELICWPRDQTLKAFGEVEVHQDLKIQPTFTMDCSICHGLQSDLDLHFCRTFPSRNVSTTWIDFEEDCLGGTCPGTLSLERIGIQVGPNGTTLIIQDQQSQSSSTITKYVVLIGFAVLGCMILACLAASFKGMRWLMDKIIVRLSEFQAKKQIRKAQEQCSRNITSLSEESQSSVTGMCAYENMRNSV